MLMAAEDKLQELLHSSDADGDAISRLAVSCVGWLRAPLWSQGAKKVEEGIQDSSKAADLQWRVRRLLI
jgi:hypothetical protein